MENLPAFMAATLGDALAYELGLLIALVLVINIRRLFVVIAQRFHWRKENDVGH
jgi:hypothetical protein